MIDDNGRGWGRIARAWLAPAALVALVVGVPLRTTADEGRVSRVHTLPLHPPGQAKPRVTAGQPVITYNGGHIISRVQVVSVIWGAQVSPKVIAAMPAFYTELVNSSYMDWMGEYDTAGQAGGTNQHLNRGTFLKQVQITPNVSGSSLGDNQIQSILQQAITAGTVPMPVKDAEGGYDTIYMIHFPDGITITDPTGATSCQQFCAYHGTLPSGVPYGVIPDVTPCIQGCGGGTASIVDAFTASASHELGEALTDTEVGINNVAWYDSTNMTGEIGDYCAMVPGAFLSQGGYVVQQLWSQRKQTCISEDPSLPLCSTGKRPCRACSASDNGVGCSGATPVCDTDPMSAHNGLCVACVAAAQCTTPAKPACDATSNTCRGCQKDAECAMTAGTPKCDTASGACVACLANADCTSNPSKPACDATSHTCRGCTGNADCTSPAVCATTRGACVQCNASTDCAAPQVCDPGTNACVGCDEDSDCKDPANPACDRATHTCATATAVHGQPVTTTTTTGCALSGSTGGASGAPIGLFLGLTALARRRKRRA